MPPTLDVRLLGPLEVRVDGEVIDLGPPRHRALVALLALTPNRVVSTDRILEALWGEEADSKEKALWVYVSRLRSALEPDRSERGESSLLVRRDPGYLLAVQPGDVDAVRFEDAVVEARALVGTDPEGALGIVDDALGLWRGDALEEFRYEDFAVGEIDRLEELRLEALEIRFEVSLGLGRDRELVGQLEQLAREHPYREGLTRALMLALYRSGRQAEALRAFERHARTIGEELGLEPSLELRRLEEQVLLQDESLRRAEELVVLADNPYRGLRPFGEDQAGDFHGRGRLTTEILRRLERRDGLVAVVGASGSGKSSVVRAGTVPLIRKGAVEGSDRWQVATMVPAAHPFTELEVALAKSTLEPVDRLGDALRTGAEGILHAALRVLPHDEDARLLLVIDQFEELFTLVEDPSVSEHFLDALVVAANDSRRRVTILLTLRADFYDKPLQHPSFGPLLGPAQVNVTPMTGEELEEAASLPAREAGVTIEPALLSQLVVDVSNQPSALPMFQYALTELYERRDGSVMRLADYQEMGGIRGAIAHRANSIHERLTAERKEAARQLFLRLVARSSDGVLSRRRVPASAVTSLDVDVVALQDVLQQFGGARLLTFDRSSEGPTVEVGHEALLTEWDLLGEWIGAAGKDLDRHASLVAALEEWERSDRNEDYLARGAQLAEFEHLAGSGVLELNAPEMEFLGAALDHRSHEAQLEEARRERTQMLESRSRNRLRGLVATFALVAIAAVVLAVFVFRETPTIALVGALPREESGVVTPGLIYGGFDRAKAAHDFEAVELPIGFTDDATEVLSDLGEAETDLVLVDVFTPLPPEIVAAYPDTWWVQVQFGFPLEESENHLALDYAVEEAAFLAGAAAARTTQTGVIGIVGGLQLAGAVEPYASGFEAGARYVDPGITVLRMDASTDFSGFDGFGVNEIRISSAVETLVAQGADVFLGVAGGGNWLLQEEVAALAATRDAPLWLVGVDGDQRLDASPQAQDLFLTSIIPLIDQATEKVIDDFFDGDLEPGQLRLGFADNGVGVATSGGQLSGLTSLLGPLREGIASGAIEVPLAMAASPLPPAGFNEAAVARVMIGEDSCVATIEGEQSVGGLRVEITNTLGTTAEVGWQAAGVTIQPGGTMTWYTTNDFLFADVLRCYPDTNRYPEGELVAGEVAPGVGLVPRP